MENTLYYGDNLDILRRYIPDESVDLVYLDPPFKSNQNYNVLFKEKNGTNSVAQIKAFEDTWYWDKKAEETFLALTETAPKKIADLMMTFREFLGRNDVMSYLVMMAIRLIELHRVLKNTGSIYLHCDPTASHYLKMVMDSIFGFKNFRNEIIWHYRRWTAQAKRFQRLHDVLLFYTKSEKYHFNQLIIPYTKGSIQRKKQGVLHRFKRGDKPYLVSKKTLQKEGVPENDVWSIPFVAPSAKERLGYPTQKPEALLERIIKSSSNEGNIVLDPFCGCGTTITVAEKLKRKWIGIDITHLAISLMKFRLKDTFGNKVKYKVIGEPVDIRGAEALANQNAFEFERWAISKVGARPTERDVGDKGIDGYIYFHDEPNSSKTKKILIQVKGGHINPSQIRDLKGTVDREKAQIGVFITLKEPTSGMKKEALSAGYYKSPGWGWGGKNYQKIQIITIKELLNGGKIDYPPTSDTFKKAPKHKETQEQFEIKEN